MPKIILDLPDSLLVPISTFAQSNDLSFEESLPALIEQALEAAGNIDAVSLPGEQLLQLWITRARTFSEGVLFTTIDLASTLELEQYSPNVRKSVGKQFSRAVAEGEVFGVVSTGDKTAQNKKLYVRQRVPLNL